MHQTIVDTPPPVTRIIGKKTDLGRWRQSQEEKLSWTTLQSFVPIARRVGHLSPSLHPHATVRICTVRPPFVGTYSSCRTGSLSSLRHDLPGQLPSPQEGGYSHLVPRRPEVLFHTPLGIAGGNAPGGNHDKLVHAAKLLFPRVQGSNPRCHMDKVSHMLSI